jgi:alpha-amylase
MKCKLLLFISASLVAAMLLSCRAAGPTPAAPVTGMPEGTEGYPWWNDSVFYQVFIRSFYDSTGDGIGDLQGLIEKLDYLNDGDPSTQDDLGVTGIWLLPIHPSPSYHGYDVTDYYAVNPEYGTLEDFQLLLEEAHRRGIRIIIDLVLNHTSERHPWFRASRSPDSEFRDWYVWEDSDPGFLGPWGQQVWHRTATGYYYGVFWGGMPDLNYENPEVTAQMLDVTRFWLEEVGVDGFRIDGAQHLIEDGAVQKHTESTFEWFRGFRDFYKSIDPEALAVGEVWDTNFAAFQYAQGDQLDLVFNFDLAEATVRGTFNENARRILDNKRLSQRLFLPKQYATFLTNHDIDRVMTQLQGDANKARTAASMLLTSPGVPFIYYGEEIGMVGQKPDELIRTPMQWSSEDHAGFTVGSPWQRVNRDFPEKNVEDQLADPDSLLNHYKALINLRNLYAGLRVGESIQLESNTESLWSLLRTNEDETILVLVNLGRSVITDYNLSLREGPLEGSSRAFTLYSDNYMGEVIFEPPVMNELGGFDPYQPVVEIPPFSTLIVYLQPR